MDWRLRRFDPDRIAECDQLAAVHAGSASASRARRLRRAAPWTRRRTARPSRVDGRHRMGDRRRRRRPRVDLPRGGGRERGAESIVRPGQLYIGDAVSIEDARPDIEGYSPTTPINYRAGWGFLVLTNMLPNQGTGTFTLHMRAFDLEGQQTVLGLRDDHRAEQHRDGAVRSDRHAGAGRDRRRNQLRELRLGAVARPSRGSARRRLGDGVHRRRGVGSPGGWTRARDLKPLFPDYPGVRRALGVSASTRRRYANGLHTIAWVVTDVGGVTAVWAAGTSRSSTPGGRSRRRRRAAPCVRPVPISASPSTKWAARMHGAGGRSRGIRSRRPGPPRRHRHRRRAAGVDGRARSPRAPPRSRRRQAKPGDNYAGYLVVNGRLRELPNGSSFDPARGAFYWQPGLGYVGNYELLFVRTSADGARERIPVNVTIQDRPALSLTSSLPRPWSSVTFD